MILWRRRKNGKMEKLKIKILSYYEKEFISFLDERKITYSKYPNPILFTFSVSSTREDLFDIGYAIATIENSPIVSINNQDNQNKINYLVGNVLESKIEEDKIIVHICNDIGAWGKGFVLSLSSKWKLPEEEYRKWYKSKKNFELGEVQIIKVNENTFVGNMISQRGIRKNFTSVPMRYESLDKCLEKVSIFALEKNLKVLMPRIGCGLAGGIWEKITPIIERQLCSKGIEVYVYDLK